MFKTVQYEFLKFENDGKIFVISFLTLIPAKNSALIGDNLPSSSIDRWEEYLQLTLIE